MCRLQKVRNWGRLREIVRGQGAAPCGDSVKPWTTRVLQTLRLVASDNTESNRRGQNTACRAVEDDLLSGRQGQADRSEDGPGERGKM